MRVPKIDREYGSIHKSIKRYDFDPPLITSHPSSSDLDDETYNEDIMLSPSQWRLRSVEPNVHDAVWL